MDANARNSFYKEEQLENNARIQNNATNKFVRTFMRCMSHLDGYDIKDNILIMKLVVYMLDTVYENNKLFIIVHFSCSAEASSTAIREKSNSQLRKVSESIKKSAEKFAGQ